MALRSLFGNGAYEEVAAGSGCLLKWGAIVEKKPIGWVMSRPCLRV